MIRCLALVFLVFAAVAEAQELPALYDVYDVADNDVLNVRAEPTSASAIIGALTPDAQNVEVVRTHKGWALLNVGEQAGWASMRYLTLSANQLEGGLPESCYGTEPFWSLSHGAYLFFDGLGEGTIRYKIVEQGVSANWNTHSFIKATSQTNSVTAIIRPAACNDGMSDRQFGFSVDVLANINGRTTLLTGCCSIR